MGQNHRVVVGMCQDCGVNLYAGSRHFCANRKASSGISFKIDLVKLWNKLRKKGGDK